MGENGVRMRMKRKHVMTTRFWPLVAVSLFCNFGNAQDSAVPVNSGYGVQGSLAMSRAQNDADMQRAIQRARETKALKEAMVAYAPTQQLYTTPAQFLSANRPPAPAPRNNTGVTATSPVKTSSEIPDFEKPANTSRPEATPAPVSVTPTELPSRRGGLLDRLFKREKESPEVAPSVAPVPSGGDLPPGPPPAAPSMGNTSNPPSADRIPEPPSFGSTTPGPSAAESNMPTEAGAPAPPAAEDTEEVAPIFQRRAAAASPAAGELAAVTAESEANVDGVLVRLYEGDKVTVLSRSGSDAMIRLPDQRVGRISASFLSP